MDYKDGKKRGNSNNASKDPELEAEILYAKENGYDPPKALPSDTVKKLKEALTDVYGIDNFSFVVRE